jgi:REP element-mobilizing transposase RayT
MVIGFHVIFTAYGFWLPNDPRGSWSKFVGAWELLRFGRATTTNERRSLARKPHDRRRRLAAKNALKYLAVQFTGAQARAVGRGFAGHVKSSGLNIWSCSILPEHTHLVVGQHRYGIEQIANLLKGAATRRLNAEGIHPLHRFNAPNGKPPKPWAQSLWKVFLRTPADVRRAIRYVENNRAKEGLPRQRWSFVTPFDAPDTV